MQIDNPQNLRPVHPTHSPESSNIPAISFEETKATTIAIPRLTQQPYLLPQPIQARRLEMLSITSISNLKLNAFIQQRDQLTNNLEKILFHLEAAPQLPQEFHEEYIPRSHRHDDGLLYVNVPGMIDAPHGFDLKNIDPANPIHLLLKNTKPAQPALAQAIAAQVQAGNVTVPNQSQLLQALHNVAEAAKAFATALEALSKNAEIQKSLSEKTKTSSTEPRILTHPGSSQQKKRESPTIADASDNAANPKKIRKQLEKKIEEEREAKHSARVERTRKENRAHEKKIFEEKKELQSKLDRKKS